MKTLLIALVTLASVSVHAETCYTVKELSEKVNNWFAGKVAVRVMEDDKTTFFFWPDSHELRWAELSLNKGMRMCFDQIKTSPWPNFTETSGKNMTLKH